MLTFASSACRLLRHELGLTNRDLAAIERGGSTLDPFRRPRRG